MKFRLIETKCKRCGKPLFTGNKSLSGADEAKKKFGDICCSCITPEEKAQMGEAILTALLT